MGVCTVEPPEMYVGTNVERCTMGPVGVVERFFYWSRVSFNRRF